MPDYPVQEKNGHAIQQAIDTAWQNGGGRVTLSPGVYLSGTIYLKSNVELHIPAGSRIQGRSRPEDYDDFRDPGFDAVTPEKSRKCLIAAAHARNIAITGQGEINGAGPDFYDTDVPPDAFFRRLPIARPRMVQLFDCSNVIIDGVSFIDSACWTFWILGCEDVHLSRLTVSGNQQMMNNDGIDIDDCRRVSVSDCFIRTGNDCIVLRSIRRSPDHHALCQDVTVTNCILDSWCQAIRIGCPSDDTIRRCTFSNITASGPGNGININNPVHYLRDNHGYLHLSDLVFNNFIIHSERVGLWINVEKTVALRYIGSMSFSNFRIRAKHPIRLEGCPETPINHILLADMSVSGEDSQPVIINHVTNLKMSDIICNGI